jgi:hypothetical protein
MDVVLLELTGGYPDETSDGSSWASKKVWYCLAHKNAEHVTGNPPDNKHL